MAAIIPAAALGAAIGAELPKFFNDARDQFGSGEGVYLRDGMPEGVVAQVGQAIGRSYCRQYDSVSQEYPPGKGERIEAACRPYLDDIGSPGGVGLSQPFEGGQCLTDYFVIYEWQNVNTDGSLQEPTQQPSFTVPGPIRGIAAEGTPGARTIVLSFGDGGSAILRSSSAPQGAFENVKIIQTVRIDGQADNCGNPPPVTVTPSPRPDPTPPPFRFNPVPEIDIDIDVSVGPTGDINFDIGFGPTTVNPFPEPTDPVDPGGGGGDEPPGPGEPGDPVGTDGGAAGGGGAEGDAPEGKVLTGLKIDVVEASPSRRRFTDEVDRGVAYVYMGVPSEGLALEPSGANLRSGQFVFAQKEYLTRWAVRARFGYILSVTPYYKDKV